MNNTTGVVRRAVRQALALSQIALGAGLGFSPGASAAAFPPIFSLGDLFVGDGSHGFVVLGYKPGAQTGNAVSRAGDINADGIDDAILGAWHQRGGYPFDGEMGSAFVVFGRDTSGVGNFPPAFTLSQFIFNGGGNGFQIFNGNSLDHLGSSVGAAGDINDDGRDDLIVSAPGADPGDLLSAGRIYVVFGGANVGADGAINVEGLDGSDGFVMNGITAGNNAGLSTSGGRDLNGDGIDDLIIGSTAQAYVVFGRNVAQSGNFPTEFELSSLLPENGGDGSIGFMLHDGPSDGYCAVGMTGDVNGDGIADLIVGRPGASPAGRHGAGEAFVVFGRDTAQDGDFPAALDLTSLLPENGGDGTMGFAAYGINERDYAGGVVSGAGDVTGDGVDDMLIGATTADFSGQSNVGEIFVVFGRNTARTGTFPAAFPLARLLPQFGGDGRAGFVITGSAEDDQLGSALSSAGDINGDGVDDVIVARPRISPSGRFGAGESDVIFGRDTALIGNFPPVFTLSRLLPGAGGDGTAGFTAIGVHAQDYLGTAVGAAGDINGDGIADLIIGAPGADTGPRSAGAGEGYVVFGRAEQ